MRTVKEAIKPYGGRVRLFFMDEARFGQQGTTTRVWAPKESRPTAVKQNRYGWVYLYAAVEPATGASVALQAPQVNTGTTNVFMGMLSDEIKANEHAGLIMDQAGWHKSKALRIPANVTVPCLPPYSPELNAVERLRGHLRSHHPSNPAHDDHQRLLDASAEARQQLTPERLRSVCRCRYLPAEVPR